MSSARNNTPKVATGRLAISTAANPAAKEKETPSRAAAAGAPPPQPSSRSTVPKLPSTAAHETDTAPLNTGFSATAKRSASKLPIHTATTAQTPQRAAGSSAAVPLATPSRSAIRRGAGVMASSLDARMTPECFARVNMADNTPTPQPRSKSQTRLVHPALQRANTADAMESPGARATAAAAGGRANATAIEPAAANSELSSLTVAVRVRPLNARELQHNGMTNVISVTDTSLTARYIPSVDGTASVEQHFQFDRTFWSCNEEHANYADQQRVFEGTALPLIESALRGYNACLFAYGQTGSGKSYSMMGIDADDSRISDRSEAGIIPRFCQALFNHIDALRADQCRVDVELSYFEIYNEKIHDLLAVTGASSSSSSTQTTSNSHSSSSTHNQPTSANKRTALRVREHPTWGPYVVDLSTHAVDSHRDLRNWLAVGNSQRATAATGMNDQSSRSHSIFNIVLNVTDVRPKAAAAAAEGGGDAAPATGAKRAEARGTRRSKISLVDLAGSERVNLTSAKGERLREGVSINKSLLTLGKVIAALADTKKSSAAFVPYRESVLTWLLRENLGGNSRTCMLATISPASLHVDETLSTLRYANQARTIVNRVRVNEDPNGRRIRELHAEIERLQMQAQDYERQKLRLSSCSAQPRKIIIETMPTAEDEAEVLALRQQLADAQLELEFVREQLQEMQAEEQHGGAVQRTTDVNMLQWSGLALEFTSGQTEPCLVNLAPDVRRGNAELLYLLPLGRVRLGRERPSAFEGVEITLKGDTTGLAFEHCAIDNLRGDLYIEQITNEFETLLNGDQVTERTRLFHGDRIVVGGAHYFRVSNPHCSHQQCIPTDAQFAYREVLRKQELLLRARLDADRSAAEHSYNERVLHLQQAREMLDLERETLATERQRFELQLPATTTGTGSTTDSRSSLNSGAETGGKTGTAADLNDLLERLRRFGQHPTDDQLRRIDRQLEAARKRCAELCSRTTEQTDHQPHYDFERRIVATGFGTHKAVCCIVDRRTDTVAEWPPARLDVWLERLRERNTAAAAAATAPSDPPSLLAGFDVVWQPQAEYELQCAEAEAAPAAPLNDSCASASPRQSLLLEAQSLLIGRRSPAKASNVVRPADATLLKAALRNTQHHSLTDLSKKRLQYGGSGPLLSENKEPKGELASDGAGDRKMSRFVRMVVD